MEEHECYQCGTLIPVEQHYCSQECLDNSNKERV
jgi:predicted nucleic acid-binding Zn ribbon protein